MLGLGNSLISGSPSDSNYSLHFDGQDDFLETGTDSAAATKSYSFWAKSDVTVIETKNTGVFGHGAVSTGAFHKDSNTHNPLLYLEGGVLRKWTNPSATNSNTNNWEAQIDGEWHHWVVYIEHDDITACKLWIDGYAQDATTTNGNPDDAINAYGSLKIATAGSGHFYGGLIDDFAIFDGELTTTHCAAIYNLGKPFDLNYDRGGYTGLTGDLKGYWRMDDGSGTTVVDSSGEGNNGTISGAVFSADTPDD